MRQIIIILTLIIFQQAAKGQHIFGLKANIGLSRISTYIDNDVDISRFEFQQKICFAPSGQLGVFYNLQFGKKSHFGADLLLSQIEGLEKSKSRLKSSETKWTNHKTWRNITYLVLPLYYGYKIKKITYNIGFQSNFKLASSSRTNYIATDSADIETISVYRSKNLNINNFDYGIRTGLIFDYSKKLGIEGTYYHGVNNILKGKITPNWKIQQITLGVRYKI